jgi:hypothetical protein
MQFILLNGSAGLLGSQVAEGLISSVGRVVAAERFNECHAPSSSAACAAALEAGNLAKSVTVE